MNTDSLNGINYVTTKSERKAFINFPYKHYEGDEYWVPPLKMEQKKLIDTKKNPFYENADIALFLAERNGEVVGRIAAIEDRRFNEHHNDKTGFFGFFECIDNLEIAKLLFRVAGDWLKDRGLDTMLGPASPSMMDEIGLLVEGFDYYPSILMPYTKPYYDRLLKEAGMQKAMDLYAYRVNQDTVNFDRIERIGELVYKRNPSLNIRPVNLRKIKREIDIIREIFNEAWSGNWGFIPLTDAEFKDLASDLKTIVDTDFAHVAELDGKPVAFSVGLPDYNQAFRHMDGTLFPTGLFKLLWYRRKIDRIRTALMGVKPEYQGRGIDAMLHREAIINGMEKGVYSSELGWVLETNKKMIRVAERIGARREKTYRMYQKELS